MKRIVVLMLCLLLSFNAEAATAGMNASRGVARSRMMRTDKPTKPTKPTKPIEQPRAESPQGPGLLQTVAANAAGTAVGVAAGHIIADAFLSDKPEKEEIKDEAN